jgi:hypothetical protein
MPLQRRQFASTAAQVPETVSPYSDHGSPLLMQIQEMGEAARYQMAAGVYLPPTKFAPCSAPYQTPAQTGFVNGCTDASGIKQTGASHVNLLAQHAEEKSTFHNLLPIIHAVHAGRTVHVWWTCWTDCMCLVDSTTCCNTILTCCLLAVLMQALRHAKDGEFEGLLQCDSMQCCL